MKMNKYLKFLITILLFCFIIFRPHGKNIFSILPMIGVLLMLLPSNIELLFLDYKNRDYSMVLNKVFDYSGKSLIIISILRLLYKILIND